jgi:membrane-associated phospholipid phosphatase
LKRSLSLTLGAASLFLFVVVAYLVLGGFTQASDARMALLMNAYQGAAVTTLMTLASLYGREYFWIPVVAVMLLVGKPDTKLLALELALLFVVGIAAGEVLKYATHRIRPYEVVSGIIARVATDTDSSFPSGHALITSIGAVFALLKFSRRWVSLLLTLEAAAVCLSRVYVGLHYPLDVVGGVLLGAAIVCFGLPLLDALGARQLKRLASLLGKVLGAVHVPEAL